MAEHCHTAGAHSLVHTPGTSTPPPPDPSPVHSGVVWPPCGCENLPIIQLTQETISGTEGQRGRVDEHGVRVLKAGAKVKWIGRGRRIIKTNLGKTGSGDKWREAAGRKMEQQAEGQMKGGNRDWWDEVREKRPRYVHEWLHHGFLPSS